MGKCFCSWSIIMSLEGHAWGVNAMETTSAYALGTEPEVIDDTPELDMLSVDVAPPMREFRITVGLAGTQFVYRVALATEVKDLRKLIKKQFPHGLTHELALCMGTTLVPDHWGSVSHLDGDLTGIWVDSLPAWDDASEELDDFLALL